MKIKIYTKHDWKTPFYFCGVLGFACLGGAIASIFSKSISNILVLLGSSIFLFSVSTFGGWKKKEKIDETILEVEKYEEIKEEAKNVHNTS
jgi:hypothetical protein